MDIQLLVKLYRDSGYKIHKINGYYFYHRWIKNDPFPLNSSFPPNYQISPDRKLVNALKWRFLVSPVLINAQRKDIYEFILNTDNYELENFDRKVRNRIKKSLQTCTFTRPALEDLKNDGLLINQQTCERQLRKDKLLTNQKTWDKYITSIYNNDEFIIWGAYFEGRMIGYLIIYELEEKFNMLHAFINRTNSSSTNPMCGLLYTAVNSLIKEYGRITISYGMHILQGPNPLNRFKQKMLFEILPLSRGLVINPILLLFVKLTVFITIKVFHKKNVKNKWVRNIFHLYQGHRRLISELHPVKIPVSKEDTYQVSATLYGASSKFQSITSQ